MALKLRRTRERVIPSSTCAVSFKRLVGISPASRALGESSLLTPRTDSLARSYLHPRPSRWPTGRLGRNPRLACAGRRGLARARSAGESLLYHRALCEYARALNRIPECCTDLIRDLTHYTFWVDREPTALRIGQNVVMVQVAMEEPWLRLGGAQFVVHLTAMADELSWNLGVAAAAVTVECHGPVLNRWHAVYRSAWGHPRDDVG